MMIVIQAFNTLNIVELITIWRGSVILSYISLSTLDRKQAKNATTIETSKLILDRKYILRKIKRNETPIIMPKID